MKKKESSNMSLFPLQIMIQMCTSPIAFLETVKCLNILNATRFINEFSSPTTALYIDVLINLCQYVSLLFKRRYCDM